VQQSGGKGAYDQRETEEQRKEQGPETQKSPEFIQLITYFNTCSFPSIRIYYLNASKTQQKTLGAYFGKSARPKKNLITSARDCAYTLKSELRTANMVMEWSGAS